jgi:hypothetical protein
VRTGYGLTASRVAPLNKRLSLFNQKSTICLDQFCWPLERRPGDSRNQRHSRDDKTAIELFAAGIRVAAGIRAWEPTLQQLVSTLADEK